MKKAFTLVEVSILLVIFIMVAVLVIPLSIDDTIQAKRIAKWKQAESSLKQLPMTLYSTNNKILSTEIFVSCLVRIKPLNSITTYKIKYMNGQTPEERYIFKDIYNTNLGATIAYKLFERPINDESGEILGIIMYDVNGKKGPNVWGKDVFGLNILKDNIIPFGENTDKNEMSFDCSKQGTGLYCSSYYIQGGSF